MEKDYAQLNQIAFKSILSNPKWVADHMGLYLACVDGVALPGRLRWIKSELEQELRRDFPKAEIFIGKVE